MIKWIKRLFKKKEPDTSKWIGTIKGEFTSEETKKVFVKIYFHLFVDAQKNRTCQAVYFNDYSGLYIDPYSHPRYLRYIIPWLKGAPDNLVFEVISHYDDEYFKDCEEEEKKSSPEFKLLKFEKKSIDSQTDS